MLFNNSITATILSIFLTALLFVANDSKKYANGAIAMVIYLTTLLISIILVSDNSNAIFAKITPIWIIIGNDITYHYIPFSLLSQAFAINFTHFLHTRDFSIGNMGKFMIIRI